MRSRLATLLLVALIPSAWNTFAAVRQQTRTWTRLRAHQGVAPDTGWDRYYAELLPYLPPQGRIGLVQDVSLQTQAGARRYYFLQYALAPRIVVPDGHEGFVVAYAAPGVAAKLVDAREYRVVKVFGTDFVLYRRIR